MYHFGLIGYPLGHSLSPRLHASALRELGLEGDYKLCPVPPLPEGDQMLGEYIKRMRNGEFQGFNVTIPHKQTIIPWLDALTPVASAVGAVNSIYWQQDQLIGDNTDVAGFITDLKRILSAAETGESKNAGEFPLQPPKTTNHALILGAGGSARAVVFALDQLGWEIAIGARRPEQAEELAKSLDLSKSIHPMIAVIQLDRSSIKRIEPEIRLVVNTTPIGMTPNINASPWPEGLTFPISALVYDLVYNPPETALIQAAKRAGLSTANGLGMLVEQAALSFERWTGHPAPRQAMRQKVVGI